MVNHMVCLFLVQPTPTLNKDSPIRYDIDCLHHLELLLSLARPSSLPHIVLHPNSINIYCINILLHFLYSFLLSFLSSTLSPSPTAFLFSSFSLPISFFLFPSLPSTLYILFINKVILYSLVLPQSSYQMLRFFRLSPCLFTTEKPTSYFTFI